MLFPKAGWIRHRGKMFDQSPLILDSFHRDMGEMFWHGSRNPVLLSFLIKINFLNLKGQHGLKSKSSNDKVQSSNQIPSSNEMPKQIRHDNSHSELVSESIWILTFLWHFNFVIWHLIFLEHLLEIFLISKERQGRKDTLILFHCVKSKFDPQSFPFKKRGMMKRQARR